MGEQSQLPRFSLVALHSWFGAGAHMGSPEVVVELSLHARLQRLEASTAVLSLPPLAAGFVKASVSNMREPCVQVTSHEASLAIRARFSGLSDFLWDLCRK